MKHTFVKFAFWSLIITGLVSCGSVSATKSASGTPAVVTKTYSKVMVQDFAIGANSGAGAADGRKFAEIITSEIMRVRPGFSVLRSGKPDASTLVIGGVITRYAEGNAALRLVVGLGAGSSYFDADIHATDGGSRATVVTLRADKNSWGLGGGIAAMQTVDSFMSEAAKKTAEQIKPHLK